MLGAPPAPHEASDENIDGSSRGDLHVDVNINFHGTNGRAMHRPKQPAEDERKHHLSHLVQSTYMRPTNTEQYVPKRSVNCPTTVCVFGELDVKKKAPHPRKHSWF